MIRSGGGQLERYADQGEPGDVFVVLDKNGQELGRGVAQAIGNVLVRFKPPVQLPPKGDVYQVVRMAKEEAKDDPQGEGRVHGAVGAGQEAEPPVQEQS